MKKAELEVEVQKIQQEDRRAGYERQLREDALCRACLTEQRKQRKIDDETHNERLFELTIRDLVFILSQVNVLAISADQVSYR